MPEQRLEPLALAISQYREVTASSLKLAKADRVSKAGGKRDAVVWGKSQIAELASLRESAELVLRNDQSRTKLVDTTQTRAVDAIAEVLQRRRAVLNPFEVYLGDLARCSQQEDDAAGACPVVELRERVDQAGGPAMYYHVACRAENEPSRIVFELALALLATIAQAPSDLVNGVASARAKRHLGSFDTNALAVLLENWCRQTPTQRIPVEDGWEVHAMLLEFAPKNGGSLN